MSPGGFILLLSSGQSSVADDLMAAVESALLASSPITAYVSTNIWSDEAPAQTPLPCIVYREISGTHEYATPDATPNIPILDTISFDLACFATNKVDAKAIGKLAAAALRDASLTFTDGTLLYLRQIGYPVTTLDPEKGPNESDVWMSIVQFKAIVNRYYAAS